MDEQPMDNAMLVEMTVRQLARVLIWGVFVGVIVWGVSWLLEMYVFGQLVCGTGGTPCAPAQQYTAIFAAIIGGAIGLAGLLKQQTFRPLLVVLAVVATLWGLEQSLQNMAWQIQLAAHIILYALAYGVFAWIARLRQFWVVIVLFVVLIVLMRFLLTR
jgi:hypothetical protein